MPEITEELTDEFRRLLAAEQAAKDASDKEDLKYIGSDNRDERYRAHKAYEKACGELRDCLHNHAPALIALAERARDLERLREAVEKPELRSSWRIAEDWYNEANVIAAVQRQDAGAFGERTKIPPDVTSEAFGKYLTHEYRLAMNKGIDLARREYKAAIDAALAKLTTTTGENK